VTEPRQTEQGFTLIEVMISIIITAIAVMGIIGLYKSQSAAGSFSRHNTEAAVLAQDKIEKLRTQGAAVAISAVAEPGLDAQGCSAAATPFAWCTGGGIFTRTTTETLTTANYADILVTVTWRDDGVLHTITMNGRRNR
jgi:prepilin-type N-terminal cleavage/methylation domain-containing protein